MTPANEMVGWSYHHDRDLTGFTDGSREPAGFSRDQDALRMMLESMLGVDGGPPDKLLAVTRPLTGAYYVIPSADRLGAFDEHVVAMPVEGVEHDA
jgi:deferrochelatase/peroxidase EfeB